MVIAFNAAAAASGSSGFVHCTQLLSAMLRLPHDHQLIAITTPSQHELRDALPFQIEHLVLEGIPAGALQRTAWLQWRLPAILRHVGAAVLYNKGNFHLFRNTVTQVCLIENANPFSALNLPQPISDRVRNHLIRVMATAALKRAAGVVFPSETARDRVLAQVPSTVPSAVIGHGWQRASSEPVAIQVEPPYLLAVSSMYPHRNLTVLIDALASLRSRNVFMGHLLIVGGGSPRYLRWFTEQVRVRGIEDQVQLVPAVSPGELWTYYAGATATLMPSVEETFGIPLIESMGAGVPVVAARVSDELASRYFMPFEEICGDAAEYFDPFDARSCADAIERAIREPRRSALIERGFERARLYSWDTAAKLTLQLFEQIGPS